MTLFSRKNPPAHQPAGAPFASPDELMRACGVTNEVLLAVARAAYGRPPIDRRQRRLFESVCRMRWPTTKVRQLVLCVGRRGLKTTLLSWLCAFEAIFGGHAAHAAPGSRIYATVVAPAQAQAREAVRAIKGVLDQCARVGVEYESRDLAGAPELVLTRPAQSAEVAITVLTADPSTSRGRAVFFLALDEAGFLPSESHLAFSGQDVLTAVGAGMVQFPCALRVMASTPGAPAGVFHQAVTKPAAGTLVVQAPTWTTNPAVTRAACEALAPDPHTFAQEFEASRFGYAGDSFIDADPAGCVSVELCSRGPVPGGSYVVVLDVGQINDDTWIGAASSHYAADSVDVRHVVIEHIERHRASRADPIPIEAVVQRAVAISRRFNRAPVIADMFARVEVERGLRAHGVKFEPQPMNPQAQTPRWLLLKDLIRARRLHLPDDPELLNQLRMLKATQLSGGALRVEGRRDDGADVVALACERAIRLAPTGGDLQIEVSPLHWNAESRTLSGGTRTYFKVMPDGSRVPAEMPPGSPGWEEHVARCTARGISTPGIERWRDEQRAAGQHPRSALNVRILNNS